LKASIIIPIKNPSLLLIDIVKMVLSQNFNENYELIIINSGRINDTISQVLKIQDNRIKIFHIDPKDFGHGKTRNYGATLSSGEYLVYLTHDALPYNEYWLSELVTIADSDNKIAGVFGRHVAYDDANIFLKEELKNHFDGFVPFPIVHMEDKKRYETDNGYRQFLHFFSDNNSLLRKSIWEKIPFPEVDFAEDQTWTKLIIESGYKKAFANKSIVYHSHNYSHWERLRRSFDESSSFKKYFNYDLNPSFINSIKSFLYLVIRDYKIYKKHNINILNLINQVINNFMRVMGLFLGNHYYNIPRIITNTISLDNKLLKS
jgi:rhamnosyltransferase